MCGIGLFSLQANSRNYDRSLLVKALLASVAERGEDACGYAYQEDNGKINVKRGRKNTVLFLPEVQVPSNTNHTFVHVRDHTKGHPGATINNHPLRYNNIVGAHNGGIQNDDELFAKYKATRPENSTVDSLAIFMLLSILKDWRLVVAELVGSYNAVWYDEKNPGQLHILRGEGRPLFTAHTDDMLLVASTEEALYFFADGLKLDLGIKAIAPGTYLVIEQGKIIIEETFTPQPFKEGPLFLYDQSTPNALEARNLVMPLLGQILYPQTEPA